MDKKKDFSLFEVTPEIEHFAELCMRSTRSCTPDTRLRGDSAT